MVNSPLNIVNDFDLCFMCSQCQWYGCAEDRGDGEDVERGTARESSTYRVQSKS